ncbi:hypothetical protein FACS1894216_02120 [Synergistales bacterium]|nr:hypothetical protein FACS1894216_02120 [Synergistales bacterium]
MIKYYEGEGLYHDDRRSRSSRYAGRNWQPRRVKMIELVARTISSPLYIFKDAGCAERLQYVDMVRVPGENIKLLMVVTDFQEERVITFFPMRKVSNSWHEERMVYDARKQERQ